MISLESYIGKHAQETPEKVAITCSGESLTYKELWLKVEAMAVKIKEMRENALVLRASQSIEFVITYLAAHLANKPIVPLESDIPDSSLTRIMELVYSSEIPTDIADVLYTTGTTGMQKGTMISSKAILANAENLIDSQKFSPDITFIICGPLNHIGSLSKLWPTLAVGATINILDGMKNLSAFFDAVESAQTKVATFMVPASIRIVLQLGRSQLSNLAYKFDFVETGAAPIAQSDMEELCKILPNARLYNTYASTETGIIATHNFNSDYCVAGCLGKVMKHSQLHIDNNGLIHCTGKTLMSGYIGDPEQTTQVLKDNAVYTQDIGEIDEEGRLHLTGRDGDILNIGGYKINPVEIENIVKSFDGIDDCICIETLHPVLGKSLKLLVVMSPGVVLNKKALGQYLSSKIERHKIPQVLAQVNSIKRTYNGKLDRKYYKSHTQ